jgi:putative transcriptional regulator
VFSGYAGWGPGQLEAEIEQGAWIDVAAIAQDIFTGTPERLWREVLERKGGTFRLIARMPEDPSLN